MDIKEFHDFQKDIRRKRMPNSEEIASLAQGVVTIPDNLVDKFDETLSRLLFLENDLYHKFEKECSIEIYKRALEAELLDLPNDQSPESLTKHFDKNYKIYSDLFDSVHQSKKSRAENGFEIEFDFLFKRTGLSGELKKSGARNYIYFFPSESELLVGNETGIILILARTLRDQWRKFSDLSHQRNINTIYFVTLDERITQQQLWEMGTHGFLVATFESIRVKKYASNSGIINLNELMKKVREYVQSRVKT